jgi:hypothetical protein
MPCRFPLIALRPACRGGNMHAPQRTGKHRPCSDDAQRLEEYKP